MDKSTWLEEINIPKAEGMLVGDIETEVAIVGGGLAGTFSAYLLAKAGKRVVVLEEKDITNSTTAYTTAWLTGVIDTDLSDLVKMYGNENAAKIWRSGMDAIDLVEKIVAEENINCDFVRVPHFIYATSEDQMQNLRVEHMYAGRLGFNTELRADKFFRFKNYGALEIKNQGKFHPLKFLIGLREASKKYGAVYFENTEVLDLKERHGEKNVTLFTKNGSVKTEYAIVATYKPFNNPKKLFAHKGAYISYVLEATVPIGMIPVGLYQDQKNPYHYFRVDDTGKNSRIILGGEDHRKEIPMNKDRNFRALMTYFSNLFPDIKYTITRKWSGVILETIDGLPYIGPYSSTNPNIFVATGFSGNGMTYSGVSAMIFHDLIMNNPNPYIEIYNADRKTRLFNFFKKFIDFSGELLGGAVKNTFRVEK